MNNKENQRLVKGNFLIFSSFLPINIRHQKLTQFKAEIALFDTDNTNLEGIFQVTVQQFNIYRLTPCTGFWEYYRTLTISGIRIRM